MADKVTVIQENYSKNLKALDYAVVMDGVFKDAPDLLLATMKFMYNVIHSGRFKGTTLLEIGSGALVHNIASASAIFPNIVMSDYVENNCEELKRWLKGESPLKQFLDVPAELEGYKEDLEAGKQFLENRIKQRVKQVVRCDVLKDNIFLEQLKPEVTPPYDLIISSLCLEAAAPDFDGFVLCLKRINKLLRPGGGLILVGFFQGKQWTVEKTDYHYIEITENDLRKALRESGFGNLDLKIHDKFNVDYEHDKYYCLVAEKL